MFCFFGKGKRGLSWLGLGWLGVLSIHISEFDGGDWFGFLFIHIPEFWGKRGIYVMAHE